MSGRQENRGDRGGHRRVGGEEYDVNKLGQGEYGEQSPQPRTRTSKESRMRRALKNLREAHSALEADYMQLRNQLQHYQGRIQHSDEGHKIEIQRLKKEVEYHKRLRQGAEQRAFELEDRLKQQQRQTSTFDEAQNSLIEQSTLLVGKNSELAHKVKMLELQVGQLQELKSTLEVQLTSALADRDALLQEMEQMMVSQQGAHTAYLPQLGDLEEELGEDGEEGEEEDSDAGGP